MGGIVALMWDPSPLVLVLRRKSRPRNWMKALPLVLRQSVNVQPRQGSDTARAPSWSGRGGGQLREQGSALGERTSFKHAKATTNIGRGTARLPRPFLVPLFTGVRGRRVLRSRYAASCMERPAHSPLRCSAWSYGQGLTTTSWIRAMVPSAWAAEALIEPGMESCGADARRDAIVIGRQLGVVLL
jgi:hypothetical protein